MTVRTLKRRLKSYHLSRRNENISEDNVRTLLRQEMQAAGGSLAGYRKMWHILRIQHHVHVPRKLVATILRQLDPEASIRRRRKRLQRQYISQGPNQCWHIDGYDKLKPFGFPIHGAVDGFSRKVLWLEVVKSNNAPESVAQLYLDAVRRYRGCPLQIRSDCGTENGVISAAQCYFRANDSWPMEGEQAHTFGTSTHNQRIENWWSHLKKSCTSWWIQFFKDFVQQRQLNLCDDNVKQCLWFAFQSSLDEVQLYWNTHHIRPSRHETVSGVPDILFSIPEQYGGFDCLVQVPDEKLQEVEMRIAQQETENGKIFQDYFNYLVDIQQLEFPEDYNDATNILII
ncbi:uncharacterized protein LOC124449024 [Xenia sp. Carnegie-2017]|uniref:uncharacterized protein LOC124449024 n=1 Tax=Xenia sp. Carnegie-2017 TaxID=2897299 RepID=UPI001F042552|nr:uncharacterized protein LOC124449024 [Xenia sp. Carnegie-2017]